MNNTIKTIILFGALAAVMISVGKLVAGNSGMWLMLGIGILFNLGTYFFSDKIAISSSGAEPMDTKRYSLIKEMVEEISKKAKIPMPELYLSSDPQPNAFATGRNPKHSSIVVTEGLIRNLNRDEIRGVLAHEIGHIRNRDILIATAASVVASVITAVSSMLRWSAIFGFGSDNENRNPIGDMVAIILAPFAALILQLAISRSREFQADETGAKLAGSPEGLASALQRIDYISRQVPPMDINPAFSNLYIANPFGDEGISGLFSKLFSTHPPVGERIARLRRMKKVISNQ